MNDRVQFSDSPDGRHVGGPNLTGLLGEVDADRAPGNAPPAAGVQVCRSGSLKTVTYTRQRVFGCAYHSDWVHRHARMRSCCGCRLARKPVRVPVRSDTSVTAWDGPSFINLSKNTTPRSRPITGGPVHGTADVRRARVRGVPRVLPARAGSHAALPCAATLRATSSRANRLSCRFVIARLLALAPAKPT